MTAKVVAIIQARMASSRLYGKVLLDIGGIPMLGRVLHRTELAKMVNETVVATSTDASDQRIADYCLAQGITCIRGSHFDVLDRYHLAAQTSKADVVVRITADCPLIDPGLIDQALGLLALEVEPRIDFAATRLPPPWKRTFPIGQDVECCRMADLERAWNEAKAAEEREHVMPFLYKGVVLEPGGAGYRAGTSQSGMRIAVLDCEEDLGAQRWTVDTGEDLEFARAVFSAFNGRSDFSWLEVRSLLESRPELLEINAGVRHKTLGEVDARADGGKPA
ncbi:MAG TPA: glycosyltransferase family protein [Anaerolineales bacterium]|nr:glycosyltransferase family protein [Anaerolineales bacterium]